MKQGNTSTKHRRPSRPSRVSSSNTQKASPALLLKHAAMGAGIALAVSAVLLLPATAICYGAADPNRFTSLAGILLTYLAALIGGLVSVRLHHGAPIPCGLLCGGLLAVFFLFLTVFWEPDSNGGLSVPLSLLMRTLIPVVSLLGARLGAKSKSTRRRSR